MHSPGRCASHRFRVAFGFACSVHKPTLITAGVRNDNVATMNDAPICVLGSAEGKADHL